MYYTFKAEVEVKAVTDFLFLGSKITVDGDFSQEIRISLLLGKKSITNLDRVLKSKDITLPTMVHIVKAMVFPVVIYGCKLDHKEGWMLKSWCFWRCWRRLESPLDSKEIIPVNPKGNQPWIFIGRTDTEAEAPMLWPPDARSRLIGKEPDAGKDWRQKKGRVAEDEMFGWLHRFNGHELEWPLGDREGQGSLVCCSPWGRKELDMT